MTQVHPSQLLRRDDPDVSSYYHTLVAIDALFLVGFFIISGLCVRVFVTGQGRRLPYAWLLASSSAYLIFLALDMTGNVKSATFSLSNIESIHLSNAIGFFHEIGFFSLFFAIASVFLKCRILAFELSGMAGAPANVSDVLVVLVGVAIYAWLVISSFVLAGMNVWANALILQIENSPVQAVTESEVREDVERQLHAQNASYVLAGAQCTVCIYVGFAALYSYLKARTWAFSPGQDKALKWIAYLLPPLCFVYVFYDLWFTITGAPGLLIKVYKTEDDVQRANIATAVLRSVIPFLMSLVLIVVGLRQSWWNRALDSPDEFVKLHDLKTRPDSDTKSFDA